MKFFCEELNRLASTRAHTVPQIYVRYWFFIMSHFRGRSSMKNGIELHVIYCFGKTVEGHRSWIASLMQCTGWIIFFGYGRYYWQVLDLDDDRTKQGYNPEDDEYRWALILADQLHNDILLIYVIITKVIMLSSKLWDRGEAVGRLIQWYSLQNWFPRELCYLLTANNRMFSCQRLCAGMPGTQGSRIQG